MNRRALIVLSALIRPIIALVMMAGCSRTDHASSPDGHAAAKGTVILYCATDREIAQDLIDQFEKKTRIQVEAKFDTEAAKAVGLVQAIRQEKAHPQCDVPWGGGSFFCTILANDG